MPDLIIIAGCNGAGKSTFASSFLPEGLTSFDYDRLFLENLLLMSDRVPDYFKHRLPEIYELIKNDFKGKSEQKN